MVRYYKRRFRPKFRRTKRRSFRRRTYRKKRSFRGKRRIPYGFKSTHVAYFSWTGAANVNLTSLQQGISQTFSLNNPWIPDYGSVTNAGTTKPAAFQDCLDTWREATVISSKLRIEQEPNTTGGTNIPTFVFLRKKTGNNAGTADVFTDANEMYREVNKHEVRVFGDYAASFTNTEFARAKPMNMFYHHKKDLGLDSWDNDLVVNAGSPIEEAFCHLHFMNCQGATDPGMIRYRIWIDYMIAFRGRKLPISQ